MKIKNETNYDTKELRKIIWNEIKDYEFSDRIIVKIVYRRTGLLGQATLSGGFMKLCLEREQQKISRLVGVIRHELLHSCGVNHKDFLERYVNESDELKEEYANLELPKKPVKEKPEKNIKEMRYEKVIERIKDKESRIKRLANSLKKLHQKKKYYEKISMNIPNNNSELSTIL